MSRWDFLERDSGRELAPSHQREERRPVETSVSVSLGRGPSDRLFAKQGEESPRRKKSTVRFFDPKIGRRNRGREYSLREREIRALADMGTFRTLDIQDLKRMVYLGDGRTLSEDLRQLRAAGLIEEKLLLRAHKNPRRVVALTEKGQRMIRETGHLGNNQVFYHGFVSRRDTEHDADLYKVYQQAVAWIRKDGGKPVRVRLDEELKALVRSEKNRVKRFSREEQRRELETFARERNLPIYGRQIHVPDLQLEYETKEGELARTNLELVSENYWRERIRDKARSGFAIYARAGDMARVRRALPPTSTVGRIASL